MRLNAEQRTLVDRWLKERRIRACPTCGLHDFYIAELTPTPVMVHVITGNCAQVLLFDAQAIGLVRDHI